MRIFLQLLVIGIYGCSSKDLSDRQVLQAAIDRQGDGATISLRRSRTYVLESGLDLRDLKGVTINGNGATIQRADQSTTTLADDYVGGTTIRVVTLPDDYRVGDRLAIANGQSIQNVTLNPQRIVSISVNEITIEQPFNDTWEAGSTVFKTFYLIRGLPSHIEGGSNPGTVIENIVFDGNARNNSINYGWVINGTIGLHGGKTSEIRYNRFIDIPNETIVGHGVSVHDNVFIGLNGSAFHTSVHDTTLHLNGLADFSNNHVEDVNRAPKGMNGHSEGAITFSWGGGNLTVADNYFYSETGHYGLLGHFSGQAQHTDENLTAIGNLAYNFEFIIDLRSTANNVLITRNEFSNMGINDFSGLAGNASLRIGCNMALDGTIIVVDDVNNRCD